MNTLTHRQYLAWQEWLDQQWNQPGRLEHYLMQLTAEVFRPYAKHPQKVRSEHYRIEFVRRGQQPKDKPKLTVEQRTKEAKFLWALRTGKLKLNPDDQIPPMGS